MTAIVLPDVDRSTIDELVKRLPNLKEIELPKMENVGRDAEKAVDRLLGRSRTPVWPWVAAGIGLVALVGVIGAYFAWFRRPTWQDSAADLSTTSATGVASDPEVRSAFGSTEALTETPSPFGKAYEEA
jgi:hypothetical protein